MGRAFKVVGNLAIGAVAALITNGLMFLYEWPTTDGWWMGFICGLVFLLTDDLIRLVSEWRHVRRSVASSVHDAEAAAPDTGGIVVPIRGAEDRCKLCGAGRFVIGGVATPSCKNGHYMGDPA